MATSQHPNLKLNSPSYVEPMYYKWPLQTGSGVERHDSGIEILDTIRMVCEDMPEIKAALENIVLHEIDTSDYASMRNVCDIYNKAIDSVSGLESGTSLTEQRLNKFASKEMLRHVIQLVYNTAVVEPDKLNKYESFSPEVYGETSFELVCQMIDQIKISPDDVFIDLGSGVGQVVLQMAGALQLKTCIGIERADVPSQYAIDMDLTFRRWMRWFGKKYNEYELIKGDFLADEHREKINTATIVFVNNFAFGPNVDHQLKERFADLRDGARIVSSKSFCPLNFRITERNLSDIGTIIHVNEMSSLRGSVSWTDKPVSYYLHVIDRTKLERYFQRLKNPKACDENSNGRTNRQTRNANAINENSTDSDPDISNGNSNSNSNSNRSRRTWSEATNYKDSLSDDEENNNGSRNRKNSLKKRKKLTRKVATKVATTTNNSNSNSNSNSNGVQKKRPPKLAASGATTICNKKGGRTRKFKIIGLDLLHSHTLSSTSTEAMSRKLPAAPGTIDQQLTSLTGDMTHEELEIPFAPSDTPYGLQILLDLFRTQFMQQLEQMRSPTYKDYINQQVTDENERNKNLLNRVNQLEKQIKVLIDDSVALLKARMNELGIEMTSQNDLLAKAKEIVGRHKELQVMAAKLQTQVGQMERDQNHTIMNQVQFLASKWTKPNGEQIELSPQTSQELVLKEIASTLSHRKKLKDKLIGLEQDMQTIESTQSSAGPSPNMVDEKKGTTITPILNGSNPQNLSQSTTSYASATISLAPPSKPAPSSSKSQRKSRENRTRSQEWPDIPDVGKIEENNPEILAQKILETGRQIEAGRLLANPNYNSKHKDSSEQRKNAQQSTVDNSLMPAPTVVVKSSRNSTPANVQTKQKNVSDTPKLVNFEDRLKSIITSALSGDQEPRKVPTKHNNVQSTSSQPTPVTPVYVKGYPGSQAVPMNTHPNQNQPLAHTFNVNNSNFISGTHHLNSSTTISAIKPSNNASMPLNKGTDANSYAIISNKFSPGNGSNKYSNSPNQPSHHNNSIPHQYQQQSPIHYQKGHQSESVLQSHHSPHGSSSMYPHHRDKMSIEPHHHSHNSGREHLSHQNQFMHHIEVKNEFKAPEKMRFDRITGANVSLDEHNMNRAFIAENMNAYNSSSRPSSTSSASSGHHQLNRQMIAATSPSPSPNNLPDYTQVSPAKMALRRHLSQEKISQQFGPVPMSSKTIGDLVNGEIERTLEISHQSIINAAVDMSAMATGAVINERVQRPERVNVRVMDELMPPQHQPFGQMSNSNTFGHRNREITKSPVHLHGQSNLATLAHVAYNHKQISGVQPQISHQSVHSKPLTIQTASPRSTNSAQYSPSSNHSRSSYTSRQREPIHQSQQPAKYMPLPRADMKPNWESFFYPSGNGPNDTKPMIHQHLSPNKQMVKTSDDDRTNGPPLEGLAASLQQRVLAQMKIKEEHDERQKQAELNSIHNGNISIASIKTEVSSSLKRSSPIIQNHRAAKIRPHYGHINNNGLLSPNGNHRSNELMSPEINSMMAEDRVHIRPKHDDEEPGIDDGEDESHWQDRVSSGFDRLVAFASIELTKSRRSIEEGPPSISPDSGINHSSDGRTFLSSSSSSSQLDAPTNLLRTIVPIMKSSPAEVLESPPPQEMPRTPSPSSPPIYSAQSPFDSRPIYNNPSVQLLSKNALSGDMNNHSDGRRLRNHDRRNSNDDYDLQSNEMISDRDPFSHLNNRNEPNLKIPLKYQRQSKSSQKPYKKKFRTWEYEDDANSNVGNDNSLDDFRDMHYHHKSSKFRPKGKDYDWRNHENDAHV